MTHHGGASEKIFAERPTINVNADNHAIIMYRRFGQEQDRHERSDLGASVVNLNNASLPQSSGFLTADGRNCASTLPIALAIALRVCKCNRSPAASTLSTNCIRTPALPGKSLNGPMTGVC
jgi:hypothetical protein